MLTCFSLKNGTFSLYPAKIEKEFMTSVEGGLVVQGVIFDDARLEVQAMVSLVAFLYEETS